MNDENKQSEQTHHTHPILRDRTALPPKRVEPRLIIPVEEPSTTTKPVVRRRVGCCG